MPRKTLKDKFLEERLLNLQKPRIKKNKIMRGGSREWWDTRDIPYILDEEEFLREMQRQDYERTIRIRRLIITTIYGLIQNPPSPRFLNFIRITRYTSETLADTIYSRLRPQMDTLINIPITTNAQRQHFINEYILPILAELMTNPLHNDYR